MLGSGLTTAQFKIPLSDIPISGVTLIGKGLDQISLNITGLRT